MPPARKKRPLSAGSTQPRTKQPKLHEKLTFRDDESIKSDQVSGSDTSNTGSSIVHEYKNNVQKYLNSWGSADKENMRLTESNDKDAEETGVKYDLGGLKLKELRVILEDIQYGRKNIRKNGTSDTELWEVEKIIGKSERGGDIVYLIKWKNWDSRYNTWEPVTNLINCKDMLEDFEGERIQLFKKFKETVQFYPNIRDVEDFLKEIKFKGETVDCRSIQEDRIISNIRNFLKQKYIAQQSKLETTIKDDILRALLCKLRKKQLVSLKDWEAEMNSIAKGKPMIRVENNVDLEPAPEDFYYIDEYLPGAGVIIPDDPLIGCDCSSCDSKTKCCFAQCDGYFPYTSAQRIRVPPGTPIYECNRRCACDINCPSRVVQRGTNMKLCIFRTSNGTGWGVKTLRVIKKGTFVTEYVGEVLTSEEAEKRGKEYDEAGRTYLFDLDYNETEGQCPYTVDAAKYGNVSHFINHSCDPNLAVYGVWINCLDPNLPKIALFAKRDIRQNEEITFDYMCQSSRNSEMSMNCSKIEDDLKIDEESEKKVEMRPETPESDFSYNKTLCKCGAQSCRRYLF